MKADPKFCMMLTAAQKKGGMSRAGESPFLTELRAGRLPNVRLFQHKPKLRSSEKAKPNASPVRQTAPMATDAQVASVQSERAALTTSIADKKGQLAKLQTEQKRRWERDQATKSRVGTSSFQAALFRRPEKPQPKRATVSLQTALFGNRRKR